MADNLPTLDPRLTPARPDLAARHLKGQVTATHFVDGMPYDVVAAQASVRRAPSPDAPLETEAVKGERVIVYETTEEGWSWGQLEADGYVGWLSAEALAPPRGTPSHKVAVVRTLVFPGPSIKLPPVEALTLGARLEIVRIDGPLAVTSDGRYVPARHLAPIKRMAEDFVSVAELFLGVPYLWGGRTSFGIDCSGLVQVSLNACGIPCLRDSDMQQRSLAGSDTVPEADLRRGDLIFWNGHVAIVRDTRTLIHANAFHMAVAIEAIEDAISRIRASGGEVLAVARNAGLTVRAE